MKQLMIVNQGLLLNLKTAPATLISGIEEIGDLIIGALGVLKDDKTVVAVDGNENFATNRTLDIYWNRTHGDIIKAPPIQIKNMSYHHLDGAAETTFVKYLGDNGTTTTDSVDNLIGTPTAGDTHIVRASDPTMNFNNPNNRWDVEYVVLASDTDNDAVVAGIVAAWNANTRAASYATAAVVGTAAAGTLGMSFTGLAGKQLNIVAAEDLYGLVAATGVTDTAYVFPICGIAAIQELERQYISEYGGSDSWLTMPGLMTQVSDLITTEVYNCYVINWYNEANDVTEKQRDQQELVIFYEDADQIETDLGKVLEDVITTRS